jgi:hypothetical protein
LYYTVGGRGNRTEEGGGNRTTPTVSSTKPCLFILHGKVINALTIIEEKDIILFCMCIHEGF